MERKIIFTESQFKHILAEANMAMASMGSKHRASAYELLCSLKNDEAILKSNYDLQLFPSEELFDKILAQLEKTPSKMNQFLRTDKFFTDDDAMDFVAARVKNDRNLIQGDNKYAAALAEYNKGRLKDEQDARDAKRAGARGLTLKSRFVEKMERYNEFFKTFDFDAYNFYNNVKGQYPIEINEEQDPEQINEELMPYFEQDPDYQRYMEIKNIINNYSMLAFDGKKVYAPAGRPSGKDLNGNPVWKKLPDELVKANALIKKSGFTCETVRVTSKWPEYMKCFYFAVQF